MPALKPCMYVVLSCLKGSKGTHYTEMELKKLTDGQSLHRHWEHFTNEVEGVFCPQLQKDWAHNALKKLRQSNNMSIVSFIAEFMKLMYCAKTNNKAAVSLLEDNVHPHIQYQLFSTGHHSANYDTTLTAIKEIGSNLKTQCMCLHAGQEAGPSKIINQIKSADFGPGPGNEEDISTLMWDDKKKKGKGIGGKGPAP